MIPKSHRRPHRWRPATAREWVLAVTLVVTLALAGGTAAYAAATAGKVVCEPATVHADGTYTQKCKVTGWRPPTSPTPTPTRTTPAPSPTASPNPTPTASPTPTSSPTPTPTPTPTGPQLYNCAANPGRCGYPTPNTTGWITEPQIDYFGDLVIRNPGTYEGLDVHGCVDVRSAGVVIRDSRIACEGGTGILLDETTPAGSVRIERVEVTCVNNHGSGIWGHDVTAVGVWVHHCENGFEINANSLIQDSLIEAAEANAEGHGDGIQSQGGNNVVIRHNTLLETNPVTSAIITNPTLNNGWLVEDNLMGGGAYTLYCPEQGTNFVVRNNRFTAVGSSPYGAAYGLTDACGHAGITWTGNIRDDTGSTVIPE